MTGKILAAIVLLTLLTYGSVKAAPLLFGPTLAIDTPIPYTTYENGVIPVEGVAQHTESLFLNGGALYIDTEGRFSTMLVAPSGGAILSFEATDRFGRTVVERRVVHTP